LDALLAWIAENPAFASFLVFGFACFEAVVGIGLFISGAFLLSITTFLYVQGLMTIPQMLPLAFVGAFIGDQSGYWLGRKLGPAFHSSAIAVKHRERIERAQKMIHRFGWGAILIGRLITPIRSVVPLLTGVGGLAPLRYVLFDLLAVAIWTLGLWGLTVGTGSIFSG